MLQIGRLGKVGKANTTFSPTRLTPDEQYFQMSFWAIISAPLIISCDLEHLDDFTRGILCNREVIAVNQTFHGPSEKVLSQDDGEVWIKPLGEGRTAVGFFNKSNKGQTIHVPLSRLKLKSPQNARDLWKQENAGHGKPGNEGAAQSPRSGPVSSGRQKIAPWFWRRVPPFHS